MFINRVTLYITVSSGIIHLCGFERRTQSCQNRNTFFCFWLLYPSRTRVWSPFLWRCLKRRNIFYTSTFVLSLAIDKMVFMDRNRPMLRNLPHFLLFPGAINISAWYLLKFLRDRVHRKANRQTGGKPDTDYLYHVYMNISEYIKFISLISLFSVSVHLSVCLSKRLLENEKW